MPPPLWEGSSRTVLSHPHEGQAGMGLRPGASGSCRASLALGMMPQLPQAHGSASDCRGALAASAESGARVLHCLALCPSGPQRTPVREPHSAVGLGWHVRMLIPSRLCPAPSEPKGLHPSPGGNPGKRHRPLKRESRAARRPRTPRGHLAAAICLPSLVLVSICRPRNRASDSVRHTGLPSPPRDSFSSATEAAVASHSAMCSGKTHQKQSKH